MRSIIPDGFTTFCCKGGACRHTCCQVWEIDIDPDTAVYYQSLPGKLGKELQQAMAQSADGTWYFTLNEKGYCHFLEKDGLCRVIKELGEEALCDICAVHPRFFTYVGDSVLCGTGLCCEKTCEILQHLSGPLGFTEEDTGVRLSFSELVSSLGFALLDVACHFTPAPSLPLYAKIFHRLSATEHIDTAWTADMETLPHKLSKLVQAAQSAAAKHSFDTAFLERLYQYILYRQLDKAAAYGVDALITYARESTEFIYCMAVYRGDLLEQARRWSEQIEYDTDNVDLLLQSIQAH